MRIDTGNPFSSMAVFNSMSFSKDEEEKKTQGDSPFGTKDTVHFSDEAISLAKQMLAERFAEQNGEGEEDGLQSEQGDDVRLSYKKIFNEHRGNGLFSEDEKAKAAGAGSGGNSIEKSIEKIEKEIAELTSKLQAIMESDSPDATKQAQAGEISQKITQLKMQLSSLQKQASQAVA